MAEFGHSKRKKQRVSYSFLNGSAFDRHCFGVNAVAFDPQSSVLYTAGRDSTIRSWRISDELQPTYLKCLEFHSDWVNDILLVNSSRLVSCSSDCSIVISSVNMGDDEPVLLQRLLSHSDYVKKLAHRQGKLFSAGLDGSVNINLLTENAIRPVSSLHTKHSLYSMAVDGSGNIVAVAGSEQVIRIFDTRIEASFASLSPFESSKQQQIAKLKGHSDIIKVLLISEDGRKCISGASDSTIKVWDLSMGRCIQTLYVHDDSVWNLWSDSAQLDIVYSCGRDGLVTWIDWRSSPTVSIPLCKETSPILSVLPTHMANGKFAMWVTTPNPDITCWCINESQLQLEADYIRQPGADSTISSSSSGISHSVSPGTPFDNPLFARLRQDDRKKEGTDSNASSRSFVRVEECSSTISELRATIKGRPAIIKQHILNNRYQVLTQDSAGVVQLWDVLKVAMVKDFGTADFDKVLEQLTTPVSVPNWFSVDTKAGSLTVHLDHPQCFDADVYATDIELNADPEVIVNIGELVIRSLFEHWFLARGEPYFGGRTTSPKAPRSPSSPGSDASSFRSPQLSTRDEANSGDKESAANNTQPDEQVLENKPPPQEPNDQRVEDTTTQSESQPQANTANNDNSDTNRESGTEDSDEGSEKSQKSLRGQELPQLSMPPWAWVMVTEDSSRCVLRCRRTEWTGDEPIPSWVFDCISRRDIPNRTQISFWLKPHEGSDLPPIGRRRFNTTRALKLYKVAAYIAKNLEVEMPFVQLPTPAISDSEKQPNNAPRVRPEEYFILSCKGKDLSPTVSMATVKTNIWKSSADLVITYRVNPTYQDHWNYWKKRK